MTNENSNPLDTTNFGCLPNVLDQEGAVVVAIKYITSVVFIETLSIQFTCSKFVYLPKIQGLL